MKRFLRHLQRKAPEGRVFVVDEYLTSQVCSECGNKTVPFKTVNEPAAHIRRTDKEARRGEPVCVPSSFEIHGLRTCQKCRKTLNRDVNAAANMAWVGVCQVFGAEHPYRRAAPTRRACETQGGSFTRTICPMRPFTAEALSDGDSAVS